MNFCHHLADFTPIQMGNHCVCFFVAPLPLLPSFLGQNQRKNKFLPQLSEAVLCNILFLQLKVVHLYTHPMTVSSTAQPHIMTEPSCPYFPSLTVEPRKSAAHLIFALQLCICSQLKSSSQNN